MSRLQEWLADGLIITDGAWGTELQARGLPAGTIPDTWNLSNLERAEAVDQAITEALKVITPDNAAAWFRSCGYRDTATEALL